MGPKPCTVLANSPAYVYFWKSEAETLSVYNPGGDARFVLIACTNIGR